MPVVKHSDGHITNTRPYGSEAQKPKATPSTETARQFSERSVVERHGEPIRQNPQFDSLVKEDMRQVEENRKHTEGM